MEVFSKIEIGDKLSIEINYDDLESKENNMLNTQLVDKSDKCLYISPPIYSGKKYFLRKRQKITIFFYRKRGIYEFNAEVIKQVSENLQTFEIKPIGKLNKIQRRDHYRLPITLNAVLKSNKKNNMIETKCITVDLSAGGIKLVCKEEVERSEKVIVDIDLDNSKITSVEGQVVRSVKNPETNKYELGIKFSEISENDRDKIFAFIFEKQRLLRKKGLM